MLKSTIFLWMGGSVGGPPNTPTFSPLLGSFCHEKDTIARLPQSHKWSTKPQILSRFVSRAIVVWLELADHTGTVTPYPE